MYEKHVSAVAQAREGAEAKTGQKQQKGESDCTCGRNCALNIQNLLTDVPLKKSSLLLLGPDLYWSVPMAFLDLEI